MSQMLKSSAAMASATLLSRVLGLVREVAYARFMGNGWVASAFVFAFQIPNLFRRLLGEGALTAAFIPVFKEKEKQEGEGAMWEAANVVVSGLLVGAGLLVAVVVGVVSVVLLGGGLGEQTRLMLGLLRWMFPYMLLVCLAAVGMGMLNARGIFFVPALGSVVLNVVMIASVVVLAPRMDGGLPEQVYALAYGVLAAGAAQAAFQVPSLWRCGWRFRWVTPWRHPVLREVIRRMLPATVGVAAFQFNVLITQSFALFVGETVVASFQFAVRLMELPQGLFGVSLATFLLPALSGLAAEKKYPEFRTSLLKGLTHLLMVNALAGVLLVVLAQPIVRLLFEGGAFGPSATREVSLALMFLGPGLLAYSGTGILARAFYALGDTRVPVQVSVFCLVVNTVLAMPLAMTLQAGGLALANTLTAVMNLLLLGHALRRKLPSLRFGGMGRDAVWVGVGVLVAGLVAGLGYRGWESWMGVADSLWGRAAVVFVPALLAAAGYFGLLWGGRVAACRELLGWMAGGRGGRAAGKGNV